MAHVFTGDNPSQLYMNALIALLNEGKEVSPRGKKIKELRPVIFEYTNPTNRVTFLKGRVINPFFQLAEALWILAGRSDVKWLTNYNKNMANFSDDGVYFNAPYGERLRYWNKSDANNYINNPMDQLRDVLLKLKKDTDTRQAVAVIYNPIFDYGEKNTLDRPCNLILTFKIRNGKLDITVFNRSNDLHWGTFGANLCQFATIQEVIASWLGVEVGTYYQITDSLHVYLDDYGAKETDRILNAYNLTSNDIKLSNIPQVSQFRFDSEPRFKLGYEDFTEELWSFLTRIDPYISADYTYNLNAPLFFGELIPRIESCKDDYIKMSAYLMAAYQAHKHECSDAMIELLEKVPDCSWKISGLRFLSKRHKTEEDFQKLYSGYPIDIINYINREGE